MNSDLGFKYFLKKYTKVILVVCVIILIAIPAFEMISILGFSGLFNYFTDIITEKTGTNSYLAKAVILASLIPLFIAFKWSFAFLPSQRKKAYLLFIFYILSFYTFMYMLTKDKNFSFSSGEAIRYYAMTPEGIKYYDHAGFDPVYGIKLKPVDKTIARSGALSPKQISAPSNFFDITTGDPTVWYYENNDGSIELFNQPGFHPLYAQELKPITPDIVKKYTKQISNQKKVQGQESIYSNPSPKKVDSPTSFFDPISNEPILWYCITPGNHYDFFDKPGYHPKYGTRLIHVTPDVVRQYEQSEKAHSITEKDTLEKGLAKANKIASENTQNANGELPHQTSQFCKDGFYRHRDKSEVYNLYSNKYFCHVKDPNQMEYFGGFGIVKVVEQHFSFENGRKFTGDCKLDRQIQSEYPALVGQWKWFTGELHTFLPDGSINTSPRFLPNSSWSCDDPKFKRYIITWMGGKFIDRVTISPDGLSLFGVNQHGHRITGIKINR